MLPIAYQVYSARDEAEKDLDAVFAALSKMGYSGVEFAGFYGNSAEDVCALLKKHNLQAVSSHVALPQIVDDMFGMISYHKKINCKYIAIAYLDNETRPGGPGFAKTLQIIYKFGRLCKEAGIQLMYHNHDFEFTQISGQYGIDFMYDTVPAEYLVPEFDTCWIKYAGEDPAAYIRKYAGRCPVVHLKDFVGQKGEGDPYALLNGAQASQDVPFMFKPVGSGIQDFPSIIEASIQSGAEWVVVEMDLSPEMHVLEAAKVSIDYLLSLNA